MRKTDTDDEFYSNQEINVRTVEESDFEMLLVPIIPMRVRNLELTWPVLT